MIDGVAHQVGQRIFDGLDDGAVEFRVLALHLEPHFLAATLSARSRTVRGNLFQILPMGCMRVFITSSCSSVAIRFMRCEITLKPGILRAIGELQKLVAGQHQFAHQVHELVEQADADTDGFHPRIPAAGLEDLLRGQ